MILRFFLKVMSQAHFPHLNKQTHRKIIQENLPAM